MHDALSRRRAPSVGARHYHVSGETTARVAGPRLRHAIWSLNCDGVDGNVRFLDLATPQRGQGSRWRHERWDIPDPDQLGFARSSIAGRCRTQRSIQRHGELIEIDGTQVGRLNVGRNPRCQGFGRDVTAPIAAEGRRQLAGRECAAAVLGAPESPTETYPR